MKVQWTVEHISVLREGYGSGVAIHVIATQVHHDKTEIHRKAKELGLVRAPANKLLWTPAQLESLKIGYLYGKTIQAISAQVHHHHSEVRRKAEKLGLMRPGDHKGGILPLHVSPIQFVAPFDVVVAWLRAHGHTVEPGLKPGLWTVNCFGSQTPQMVVKIANNYRQRDHSLPPFKVDTGGITSPGGVGRSLTGSSMTMQLAGLLAK